MSVTYKAWEHLKSLLKVYVLGIVFFTLFRLLLIATNVELVAQIGAGKWMLLSKAMVMGLRFDTVISCYILGLPVVLLSLIFLAGSVKKWMLTILYAYTAVFFIVSFLICSVDVPFFNYFFSRLNDAVFNWMGHAGFGFKMIVQEPRFLLFFFVFLAISGCYLFFLRRIWKTHIRLAAAKFESVSGRQLIRILPIVLIVWGITFLGIRGRTEQKSPIIVGTAFFSNNAFINQLGLNPVFSLMRSTLDDLKPENKHFHKIDDADALQTMAALFQADTALHDVSPIARWQISEAPLQGRNVVLVIMESMATAKMGRFGNENHLTPFLDSLAGECWSFDNIFSAGLHTYNGIYTSLFAHPAIMHRHTMDQVTVPEMAGFSNTLRRRGYQTVFFTTHDEQFDNMAGFLSGNEFQSIVGQKDYPPDEVKSTLGVPDEFMFRFSIEKLNDLASERKPFFAAFMTGSDHDPMVIPEGNGFVRKHPKDDQAIVAYADWSLRRFLEYAARQSWYNNSVFVFVADHGKLMGRNAYDVAFSNHRIPFIIFAPGFTQPKAVQKLGVQSDVFPTVASLILPRFINNSFGIDLIKDNRPYIVFSADDKLACMNDSLLYIYRENGPATLYRYRNNDVTDYSGAMPEVAQALKHNAFSWVQASDWMLLHGKAAVRRDF